MRINQTVVKTIVSKNFLYISGFARVANYNIIAALLQLTPVATEFKNRNHKISNTNQRVGNTLSYDEKP